MKKTIVINLFAGPGAGKSTGCAYIFSRLKMMGIDAEMVTEFAKDKVWEENKEVFKCQLYISGKQTFRVQRCYGKVDVIVTDSPICLGAMYNDGSNPHIGACLLHEFNRFNDNGMNFFVKRVKPYNPNGRHQNEDEAKSVDKRLTDWLDDNGVVYTYIDGDAEGYEKVVEKVVERYNEIVGE